MRWRGIAAVTPTATPARPAGSGLLFPASRKQTLLDMALVPRLATLRGRV